MGPGGDVLIENIRLAHHDKEQATELWTVICRGGRVQMINVLSVDHPQAKPTSGAVEPNTTVIDGRGGLLLPS